jgi:hypothetical protein
MNIKWPGSLSRKVPIAAPRSLLQKVKTVATHCLSRWGGVYPQATILEATMKTITTARTSRSSQTPTSSSTKQHHYPPTWLIRLPAQAMRMAISSRCPQCRSFTHRSSIPTMTNAKLGFSHTTTESCTSPARRALPPCQHWKTLIHRHGPIQQYTNRPKRSR